MGNLGYPFCPTHPGEIIKEELQCRNIPQKKFAAITGISYTMLNDILNKKRSVSTEFARHGYCFSVIYFQNRAGIF